MTSNRGDQSYQIGEEDALKYKAPHKVLIKKQEELLRIGPGSDCTIRCNGMEWKAHTCILCPRSEYFERAFNGNFQEGADKTVDMPDDEAYATEGILLYLYTYSYPEWPTWPTASTSGLEALQQTLIGTEDTAPPPEGTPNNSQVEETQSDDQPHIVKALNTQVQGDTARNAVPATKWQTHLGIFKLADKLGIGDLNLEAQDMLREAMQTEWALCNFHELLKDLWEMEQRGTHELREAALQVVSAHAAQLMTTSAFLDQMAYMPLFATSLAVKFVEEKIAIRQFAEDRRKEVADFASTGGSERYGAYPNMAKLKEVLERWRL